MYPTTVPPGLPRGGRSAGGSGRTRRTNIAAREDHSVARVQLGLYGVRRVYVGRTIARELRHVCHHTALPERNRDLPGDRVSAALSIIIPVYREALEIGRCLVYLARC